MSPERRPCATRTTETSSSRASRSLTGHEPEMLSGEAEAAGDVPRSMCRTWIADEPKLVIDIGGGSTEFIVGTAEPERLISIDIGCVRMLEKFLHSDPPTEQELQAMRDYVDAELGA